MFGSIGKTLAVGFVTVAVITAATLPDRHTVKLVGAGGNAVSGIFHTTMTGKN